MSRLVYGIRPVEELLRSRRPVEMLFVAERSPTLAALVDRARTQGVTVQSRTAEELDELSAGKLNQGVVALAGDFVYLSVEELIARATSPARVPLLLLLDGVQDPQNLGALVRSAHVLGADGVILPKDRAASVTATVVKASAGATEHMPIARCTNLVRAIEQLKEAGIWTVGAAAEPGELPWAIDFTVPTALVLGAEGRGLRPLVARSCDRAVCVPMAGQVASLNVSAAGAILLYEVARQRKTGRG